jgi:hypothetical protein
MEAGSNAGFFVGLNTHSSKTFSRIPFKNILNRRRQKSGLNFPSCPNDPYGTDQLP